MSEATGVRPNGRTRTIRVDGLTRVEGHGGLRVRVVGGRVVESELRLFEAPRFFEPLLRGRGYGEAPDITARICGICPVAYQMSACHAMEAAFGVRVEGPLRALRRLLYCGEWIESHALHIYLLHAPDFLGYDDAIAMAKDHPVAVRRGLELKKIGNEVLEAIGGRAIHPVNVRVGGFYRVPSVAELRRLRPRLEIALDHALATVTWLATLDYPDDELDVELVALRHPAEYPMNEGRIASTRGLDIAVADFDTEFVESQQPHSNALQAHRKGGDPYLTGPLARYSLNFDVLGPPARDAARAAGLRETCANPWHGALVRAVEIVQACDDGLRIIDDYGQPDSPAVEVQPRAGTGHACTEAPRGILYHRYDVGADGLIRAARLIPPTSQNQAAIEAHLRSTVQAALDRPRPELERACERVVRCYDPCILVRHALPAARHPERVMPGTVIIGLGASGRGDDAAGLLAARKLAPQVAQGVRVLELDGRADTLLDLWRGADAAILIDAMVSGEPPGTVKRLDASRDPLPADALRRSTHDVGPAELIELARALGELPPRVLVFAIGARRFGPGDAPADAVCRGARRAAAAVLAELRR